MLGLATGTTKTRDNHTYVSNIAFNFAASDAVFIPDHTDFNHVRSGASYFTVSLWFKHDTGSPGSWEVLASKFDIDGNKREWKIDINDNDKIRFVVSSNGTATTSGISTYVVDDTDWHHLHARYSGDKTEEEDRALIIVDGTTVLSNGVGSPSSSNYATVNQDDADFTIASGQNGTDTANVFNGSIDEVCYWKGNFHKDSSLIAAQYIYNNGKPRDMRYAGNGHDANTSFIGYWKMGEFYTAGCPIPSGTYPATTTNPQDSSVYRGSTVHPLVMLNYVGGAPVRTGTNLITNGNFADGGPALAADETDETVNGWQAYTSSAGAVVSTDTSVYLYGGKSAKIVTLAAGTDCRISRDTNANMEDGEFYVLEFWWYSSTDMSNNAGQEWARAQFEIDECIEGDAQYGFSGDGNITTGQSKINQWHRVRSVGRYNEGSSDQAERFDFMRNYGAMSEGARSTTTWIDGITIYKLTGSHHGLTQSFTSSASVVAGAG